MSRAANIELTFQLNNPANADKQIPAALTAFDSVWPRRLAPQWQGIEMSDDDQRFMDQINLAFVKSLGTISPAFAGNQVQFDPVLPAAWIVGAGGLHEYYSALKYKLNGAAESQPWEISYQYEDSARRNVTGKAGVKLHVRWTTLRTPPNM
jgi:hypothetical protein